jgi:hypothetical protein
MFIENKNYKEIFSQINKQTKLNKQNNNKNNNNINNNNNKISSRNNKNNLNKIISTNKSYDKFYLNTSPSYNYFKQKNKNKLNLKNK